MIGLDAVGKSRRNLGIDSRKRIGYTIGNSTEKSLAIIAVECLKRQTQQRDIAIGAQP